MYIRKYLIFTKCANRILNAAADFVMKLMQKRKKKTERMEDGQRTKRLRYSILTPTQNI